MGGAIGDLLPLAVGVAISPVPIIAVILMLLAPRAGGTSLGFLLGWVAGVIVVAGLFWWLTGVTDLGSGGEPSAGASWLKLLLGVVMLALAVKQWRGRPAAGEAAKLPAWMAAIDRFTPAKALGLGFVLSAVNPKNLALCVAAGAALGGLSVGPGLAAMAVFVLVAVSTVAVPVIGYAVAAERMRGPLDGLKVWLEANNATVMAVLLLVLGVTLVGKGVGGLS
ncbi:GAP family protein [Phytomonospora endophytica]|uniref:Threonine/homoserine/homoserine lactone efflux protein n=1 Tax=Phytomonospora endophytica TaxID=714109 RepID=A0A841FRN9_9ACTN|nr:GAP family protein [Phytomonospora endophytica]MBB6038716.1 threonine/homoserine/homoserine lactone efflux protein [Phytomonospora endophytica]GIG68487.1 membrane protein [Phytomonospora endophytica]